MPSVASASTAHYFKKMYKTLTVMLFCLMLSQTHFALAEDFKLLSRQDLMEQFANNTELKSQDLDLFPLGMKRFLIQGQSDWEKYRISGFSRKISGRHILFSTDREGLGSASKAVIYSSDGQWLPLMLPQIRRDKTIIFSAFHNHLRWDEEDNLLYSNYCSDVGLSEAEYLCARYYYEIRWNTSSLKRLDGLKNTKGFKRTTGLTSTWTTIWENGKWLDDR